MHILVTGCAGFIGYHLVVKLISAKHNVIGIDNLNNYYDIELKKNRVKLLKKYKNFQFKQYDLEKINSINKLIKNNNIKYIIHLAAQAGVRNSVKNPKLYFKSNIEGFFNILELSRINNIKHLIFASTSSVYGYNKSLPFKENFKTDSPLSFYAATKKSNEVMAHAYSNIYNIPCTAIRFFTVYGPFGRPDMALFKFTENILKNKPIDFYNNGKHTRDFTYIDDVVQGLLLILSNPPKNKIPFKIFNIGNGKPQSLIKYLKFIEKFLDKKAQINNLPLQKGDVEKTHADLQLINRTLKFNPKIKIEKGIKKFIEWYLDYYNIH